MTGFRNFVIGCSLAAASLITPVGPVQAMPLQAPDLQIKAQGDVQNVQYYHRRYGGYGGYGWRGGWGGPYYRRGWGSPYYGGSGLTLYFGSGGYYGGGYYGGGYYPRYGYNRGYYPRRYYGGNYYYRDRYVGGGNAHVSWCLSRYRSYNPATNRFLSYGGAYKVCYSPYR
ncbi:MULTISPECIES: BA14K family protein [unclassified Ensifer]|uniref:BA14K family protein n=1 Tax=unclassified Ensifer TaxID=2633371 RepID=UPI0007127B46|nr:MULTISPECIES: BA14K family protein [unclassified Ensifer]KQX54379.1 hypothetical protein ASD49_03410 [Ensifer sp. Root1298]KQX86066.1 hypothetical protein ASD41_03380 [Ensifer sp. Root1312]KRC23125.1 hypothetical protein ASE29_03420 [Ensifer sp. Root74]KRD57544.1 hypothetical protein ASE71_12740 [Ensifer sp. Root954]